jgi:hypothetical protein
MAASGKRADLVVGHGRAASGGGRVAVLDPDGTGPPEHENDVDALDAPGTGSARW